MRGLLMICAIAMNCRGVDGDDGRSEPALFTDVTAERKLVFSNDPVAEGGHYFPEIMGFGGGFFDYDGDGDLDIYLVNGARRSGGDRSEPRLRNRLFRQEDTGEFIDVTEASGLGDSGYGMGVAVGDIDNDGDLDVYVANVGPDALYRNDDDGTFTNVSVPAGIANREWGSSVTFFDFDLDGFLDVYVTNYVTLDTTVMCTDPAGRADYCGPPFYVGAADALYQNRGNGTYIDVSQTAGIARGMMRGLGVVSADFSGDGYPDLYVTNDGDPNHLWINRGDGTFEDRALALGVAVNALGRAEAGMGVAVGDVENDGDFDLFVTHLRGESNTLYRWQGAGFQDDALRSGLAGPSIPYTGFGAGFVDIDHDGDVDLLAVNGRVLRGPMLTDRAPTPYWAPYVEPNFVFENDGTGKFRDVSQRERAFASELENSRGLAFGDIDNDGDVDVLVTNGGGAARLLRNDVASNNHWLTVSVRDPLLKRDVVGAEVTVEVNGRRMSRVVMSSYSYQSASDLRVHFGVGSATAVDRIRVRWPGGLSETFPGVAANQFITLEKGQGTESNE